MTIRLDGVGRYARRTGTFTATPQAFTGISRPSLHQAIGFTYGVMDCNSALLVLSLAKLEAMLEFVN